MCACLLSSSRAKSILKKTKYTCTYSHSFSGLCLLRPPRLNHIQQPLLQIGVVQHPLEPVHLLAIDEEDKSRQGGYSIARAESRVLIRVDLYVQVLQGEERNRVGASSLSLFQKMNICVCSKPTRAIVTFTKSTAERTAASLRRRTRTSDMIRQGPAQ